MNILLHCSGKDCINHWAENKTGLSGDFLIEAKVRYTLHITQENLIEQLHFCSSTCLVNFVIDRSKLSIQVTTSK